MIYKGYLDKGEGKVFVCARALALEVLAHQGSLEIPVPWQGDNWLLSTAVLAFVVPGRSLRSSSFHFTVRNHLQIKHCMCAHACIMHFYLSTV